ncbi:DUF2510 domain-containing protein [Curtobacterium sp. MCBD17_040]|uniref:SHOCT domain-containing protein n=1 Tax=Curtobacterium sp. MCBD17_040 TaxID=2175674 RepID=UPI001C645F7A|nr:DUF2510 domain-containing protein [Curtobacterium sp. MCBD17_040]WIB64609.1 DUF2510 domain-containing protein [Curtobacterium sp. MCBD17_040]
MSTAPGWYDDGQGQRRWWDGTKWTEKTSDSAVVSAPSGFAARVAGGIFSKAKDAAGQAASEVRDNLTNAVSGAARARRDLEASDVLQPELAQPLYEVVSHIDGKNATVRLWPDRLEWERGRGVSGVKVALGIMTSGASFLATGIKGGKDAYEMLPLEHVSGVGNKKDGLLYHRVEVGTAGGTVSFRVKREDAAQFREAILQQLRARAAAPTIVELAAPVGAAPSLPAQPDHMQQLQQLGALRDAGVLSEEEFAAKKTEILARM